MDFSWSEERLYFKKSVNEFAGKKFRDDIIERDKKGTFPHELWKSCADFGMRERPISEAYGGPGMNMLTVCV